MFQQTWGTYINGIIVMHLHICITKQILYMIITVLVKFAEIYQEEFVSQERIS